MKVVQDASSFLENEERQHSVSPLRGQRQSFANVRRSYVHQGYGLGKDDGCFRAASVSPIGKTPRLKDKIQLSSLNLTSKVSQMI